MLLSYNKHTVQKVYLTTRLTLMHKKKKTNFSRYREYFTQYIITTYLNLFICFIFYIMEKCICIPQIIHHVTVKRDQRVSHAPPKFLSEWDCYWTSIAFITGFTELYAVILLFYR